MSLLELLKLLPHDWREGRRLPGPMHAIYSLTRASPLAQRNLNNAFAYDLVPSPSVVAAALKAARRVNDLPTAVRIFEGTCQKPATLPSNEAMKGTFES